MVQIVSQSRGYRDLTIWDIANLTEEQALEIFITLRWGGRESISCPRCCHTGKHCPRLTRKQWRCASCDAVFSVTTGTPFAHRKLPFKRLLMLIFEFVSAPKSIAANQAHSRLGMTLRTAYLNAGKLREALWECRDQSPLSGVVQVDCAFFGGKPRRPNRRQQATAGLVNSKLRNRKTSIVPPSARGKIEPWNARKLLNRRAVLVMREISPRKGVGAIRTRVAILRAENAESALPIIRRCVAPRSTVMSDEGRAYSTLSAWFNHQSVKHAGEYSKSDGTNNNAAEQFFSRVRREEYGVFHGMRPTYLAFYANEAAWRDDNRHVSLRGKFLVLMRCVFKAGVSKAWCGYTQGRRLGTEYLG
ncbi:IS1595 family transposase [Chitinimonas sp. PSY-7]|uniref:IS1595 family transposase n=1 Tax=Chitinimonas sp. PSY-7 TaxID=3459088 RepID=UPI00404000D7